MVVGMERKWWTLVAVAAGTFMLLLDVTIVNVALPDIEQALDASLADLQWVIDAYALTLAALQLTAGSLADRFGRRLLFAIGIVVFTLGSLLCGLADEPRRSSASRARSRASAARSCSPPAWRCSRARSTGATAASAFGVFGAVTGIAVAVGPVLGGALVQRPLVALDLLRQHPGRHRRAGGHAARGRGVARPARAPGRLPRPGHLQRRPRGARLRPDPLQRGRLGRRPPSSVSLVAAVVLLVAFVVAEALQREPMFDLSLLRKPTFVGGLIAAFAISASLFSRSRTSCSTCSPGSACRRSRSACASSCSPARSSSPRRSPGGCRDRCRRAS